MKSLLIAAVFVPLMALTSTVASADAEQQLRQELDQLCEKTKACSLEQMRQSLPPGMQHRAAEMMGGMCDAYEQAFAKGLNPQHQVLFNSASACIRSMNALSCESLLDDPETPACQKFDELASSYD